MKNRTYHIYFLTNDRHNVLYVGVTGNLPERIIQHKQRSVPGFTKRYNVHKLVYFEKFKRIQYAIEREKQLKAGSRKRKISLVNDFNPGWKDLFDEII